MNDLTFRITAVDQATIVANKVKKSLAGIADPIIKMQRRLSGAGRAGASALGKVDHGLRTVAQSARTASDRIANMIPGMAALTGLASAGGIGILAERWGNLGFNLNKSSKLLGVSAQSLQQWHYAARRAGIAATEFDSTMAGSQNTIRGAAFGANPQAMVVLNRLGVQIAHNRNGLIDYQKTQDDVMDGLAKIKDPVAQRNAAAALGMEALLPMIQRGTWKSDRNTALQNGVAPSQAAIERAAEFQERINDLGSSTTGLANTIGDDLVPVLTPLITKMTEWLNQNRVDIANRVADAVKKFADWIGSVDWGGILDNVNKLVDKFGGWGSILRDLVAIKLGATVLGWGSSLLGLAASLTAAVTAAKALKMVTGGGAAAAGGAAGAEGAAAAENAALAGEAATGGAVAAEGAAGVAGAATAGAAATGAVASRIPWYLNPWLLGAAATVYSPKLNVGEDAVLAGARQGNGQHYLTGVQSAPGGVRDPKAAAAMSRFQRFGWSPEQSAGIAGNLLQESGFNPYASGDHNTAYGIGQWHADRQADFRRVFGKDIHQSTLEEQEKFFDWELRHGHESEQNAGRRLAAATTAGDAGAIVSRFDLRPGADQAARDREAHNRAVMAEGVLAANTGGTAAVTAASATDKTPVQVHVNVTAPAGTRVEAKGANDAYLPTRVNYSMPVGSMP